jgi:peptidoglycan/LPS O-acetylase OafA/YrhL
MDTARKNYDWIDTIRVFATLIVIIFHYALTLMTNENLQPTIQKFFLGIENIGVAAFFGISGYLVVNSLQNLKSLFEFYRRKILRIILPFTFLYILVIVINFIAKAINPKSLSMIDITFSNFSMMKFIGGLFPIDVNFLIYFDVQHYFIVGEWFIGTLIWMYLISPLLYKFLRLNVPITMLIIIAVSLITADLLVDMEIQGRILSRPAFFLVRLPEFATGMVLFIYRDKIFQKSSIFVGIILAIGMIFHSVISYPEETKFFGKYFFGGALDLHYILALMLTVYLSFIVAELLNKNFPKLMKPFNNFKDISYIAILIQHFLIIIITKSWFKNVGFFDMEKFVSILLLILITVAIILVSRLIKKYYAPFEKKLLG